jgi:hypothetical protein
MRLRRAGALEVLEVHAPFGWALTPAYGELKVIADFGDSWRRAAQEPSLTRSFVLSSTCPSSAALVVVGCTAMAEESRFMR